MVPKYHRPKKCKNHFAQGVCNLNFDNRVEGKQVVQGMNVSRWNYTSFLVEFQKNSEELALEEEFENSDWIALFCLFLVLMKS